MEFTVAAFEAEDWMRDTGGVPDYCDLLVTAQLHSFVGTDGARQLPMINETTAYTRLDLGDLTPDFSLKFRPEEHEKIGQAEALLNI